MMKNEKNFFFLNLENQWPFFSLHGLEINDNGSLRLASVPGIDGSQEITLPTPADLDLPAGITSDCHGNIYLSHPAANILYKYDACTAEIKPLPCLDSDDENLRLLEKPRGILAGADNILYVVDSGHHRIFVFDLSTLQIIAVWGQPLSFVHPRPSQAHGLFDTPGDLAQDKDGCVYVIDYGNRRVQKFDHHGNVIPTFWETLSSQATLQQPAFIATGIIGNEELIFLIDHRDPGDHMFVSFLDGTLKENGQWPIQIPPGDPPSVTAIVVLNESIYIGDNIRHAVLKFRANGEYVGQARGYSGPITALGTEFQQNILVHTGDPKAFVKLIPKKAFLPRGVFVAGPYQPEEQAVQWHQLKMDAAIPDENAHIQLFAYSINNSTQPPVVPAAENPFENGDWHTLPRDSLDVLIPSHPTDNITPLSRFYAESKAPLPRVPAKYLWIGGILSGNENSSPVIDQIRVNYNQETYLRHLPPVYAENDQSREFLQRFLSLFESMFQDVENRISNLAVLFDPYSAPERLLSWLASWLAFELDPDWDVTQQRDAIAKAFQLQSVRGTVEGMKQYIKLYANVDAHIEEPLHWTSLWCLPVKKTQTAVQEIAAENIFQCPASANEQDESSQEAYIEEWQKAGDSILGETTMLTPAHAQGAVVGTTSTLDQSHLIEEIDFGAPLFDDLAYFFYVLVNRRQLTCSKTLDKIRAVIEREKPAHTYYHLCILEAKMRVGFQSHVGIDTIVAGESGDMVFADSTTKSAIAAKHGDFRVGLDSHIGSMHLMR